MCSPMKCYSHMKCSSHIHSCNALPQQEFWSEYSVLHDCDGESNEMLAQTVPQGGAFRGVGGTNVFNSEDNGLIAVCDNNCLNDWVSHGNGTMVRTVCQQEKGGQYQCCRAFLLAGLYIGRSQWPDQFCAENMQRFLWQSQQNDQLVGPRWCLFHPIGPQACQTVMHLPC